jgi:hypothetical protein
VEIGVGLEADLLSQLPQIRQIPKCRQVLATRLGSPSPQFNILSRQATSLVCSAFVIRPSSKTSV